jgi:hypothetical protein
MLVLTRPELVLVQIRRMVVQEASVFHRGYVCSVGGANGRIGANGVELLQV